MAKNSEDCLWRGVNMKVTASALLMVWMMSGNGCVMGPPGKPIVLSGRAESIRISTDGHPEWVRRAPRPTRKFKHLLLLKRIVRRQPWTIFMWMMWRGSSNPFRPVSIIHAGMGIGWKCKGIANGLKIGETVSRKSYVGTTPTAGFTLKMTTVNLLENLPVPCFCRSRPLCHKKINPVSA